jgi:serine carboxypeptidase-like clade II
VGFSYNLDKSYKHNDSNTASDSLAALKDFFSKFPEYRKSRFFISGESYAGKYIPDLAVLIDKYNLQAPDSSKINLVSIFVGNGVMTFETLQDSTYEFMIDRSFVNPLIVPFYYKACKEQPLSDDCSRFKA